MKALILVLVLHGQILAPILTGGGTVGTLTARQFVQGNNVTAAATCGTAASTTCVVPITAVAGDALQILSCTANAVTITGLSGGNTFVSVAGLDTNGLTTTSPIGVTCQQGYVSVGTGVVNITVTYSAAHGNAQAAIKSWIPSPGAGAPVLDVVGGFVNTAGVGSPFSDFAMTSSGSSLGCARQAYANNGGTAITAVGAPWNASSFLTSDPNIIRPGMATHTASVQASWTSAGNTSSDGISHCIGFGVTPSRDWLIQDGHTGVQGNAPAAADLLASSVGYSGGGNSFNAAWTNSAANPPLYAADNSGGTLFANFASLRYLFGGTTYSKTTSNVFKWTTTAGAPVNPGVVGWAPPVGVNHATWVTSYFSDIPASETGTRYSQPHTTNGTDTMQAQLQTNGTTLQIHLECNGVDIGNIANVVASHTYYFANEFNSVVSGVNKITVYDSDGVTSLGSQTCNNTTAADIRFLGIAGIGGSEAQLAGHFIEWGPTKIDRTGTLKPMLPGSI